MDGKKTVESRFSQNGCAPYDQVAPGDVVLLKRSGDEIVGLAHVSIVRHLTRSEGWEELRSRYQQQLCATDDSFWAEVKRRRLRVTHVVRPHPRAATDRLRQT